MSLGGCIEPTYSVEAAVDVKSSSKHDTSNEGEKGSKCIHSTENNGHVQALHKGSSESVEQHDKVEHKDEHGVVDGGVIASECICDNISDKRYGDDEE